MLGINFSLGPLGFYALLPHIAAFVLLYGKLYDGNSPDSRPSVSLKSLFAAKVVFALLLSMLASSPRASGPMSFLEGVVAPIRLLGPGYFIVGLVFDLVLAAMFSRLEFYSAYMLTLANPYVPGVPLLAAAVAHFEQNATLRKIKRDVAATEDPNAAVLGYVSKTVRLVQQPYGDRNSREIKTHALVRQVPGNVPVLYSPDITKSRNDLNPHMIIVGSSGTGKSTTLYSLIVQLMEAYPLIVFDVKGDFTRAFHDEGYLKGGRVAAYVLSRTGVDPFAPVMDGETESEMVDDLMESISVLEEVGSKQAHFIRDAYKLIAYSGGRLTYEALVEKVNEMDRDFTSGRVKVGPQTKDALAGIQAKLSDLSPYFKSGGACLRTYFESLLSEGSTSVVVINMVGINEKVRAIVLELMLRKFAKMMQRRGPLAFASGKPVVAVVDEAFLVAKPILVRGGREGGSRSKLEDIARTARSYGIALILATQRLADIADGIRANCYRWVVFNTSSPEDAWILRHVAPQSILQVLSEAKRGEAYIRMHVPSRVESFGREGYERIITEGYIYQMNRKLMKSLEGSSGQLAEYACCEACGRVLPEGGPCPSNHIAAAPQPKREEAKPVAVQASAGPGQGSAAAPKAEGAAALKPEWVGDGGEASESGEGAAREELRRRVEKAVELVLRERAGTDVAKKVAEAPMDALMLLAEREQGKRLDKSAVDRLKECGFFALDSDGNRLKKTFAAHLFAKKLKEVGNGG